MRQNVNDGEIVTTKTIIQLIFILIHGMLLFQLLIQTSEIETSVVLAANADIVCARGISRHACERGSRRDGRTQERVHPAGMLSFHAIHFSMKHIDLDVVEVC